MCALRIPFELPTKIVEACKVGNLIVFAGAGVSTESIGVYKRTFYQEIKDELKIPKEERISFSKLMSLYCAPPRSRKDLFQTIKKRIDYVKSFPELYRDAAEFHRELSTIPHLDEIFTTNWDDFFERECAATPVVTGEDFAVLQDVPGRKVFKLHGSIYNFGSIVATEVDYRKRYRSLNTGIIGAKLKLILVSKTLIFLGFSFDDEDFKRVYRLLSKDTAGLMPRSYVVTLDEQAKEKLDKLGINAIPIKTSAGFFVKKLKEKLVEVKYMLSDEQYKCIYEIREKVINEHGKISSLNALEHPDSLYSQWYQDGLIHAFDRLLATMNSGENSCAYHMVNKIESYTSLIKDCLHNGNFPDVAYFTGYQNGLIYFLSDSKGRRSMPMYFLFGCGDVESFDKYLTMEKETAKLHKSAHKVVMIIASKLKSKKLVFHRRPF